MSSSKSSDLSQLMNGWKEKTNKDFVKDRITRMASACVSESNKINKNPKNFIPELPQDIRDRFTQDQTHSSEKSSHKSLNNIRNTTGNQKSFDDFDETLKSNNTRPLTSKASDSYLSSNISTRTALKDHTNNQAEKSRRDTFYLDKTDHITSIIEADNSRLTKTTLKANAFKQSHTKDKHLNSTAIASNSNKASNFPITPILHKTTLINQIASFDEEFNDEIDDNFEQSVKFNKNKSSLKSHLSSTSNTSQLQAISKSVLKQKDSTKDFEQNCRKSLNFKDKSQAEHELSSKKSVYEHSKTGKNNLNDKNEQISRSKSMKRNIIESDLEEEPTIIDEEKTINIDGATRSKKINKKANTFELVQHKESNKSSKSNEESTEKESKELLVKSKTIDKSKSKNNASARDSSPELSNKSKTINKSKSKTDASARDSSSKSNNETIASRQSEKISFQSKESKQPTSDISSKRQSSNNISKQLSNNSRQINDKTADISQNSPRNKSKNQFFNEKSVTMSRSIDEKSREQSINNLKQLLSTNKTINKSIPKVIESKSIRNDTEIVGDNSDDSLHEPIEEPVVEVVSPQPTVSKSKITIQRIPAQPKPAVTPITTNQASEFITPTNTDPFDQEIDLTNKRSKLAEKTPEAEISLNQTDSDLLTANSHIYLKKSINRSISNASSSVNMSTSTRKKVPIELKQSLLSNKQSKSSFVVPSLPNHSKTDESRNSNKHSSTRIENKSTVVQNDLGFSNIEPADMFSPSQSINEPNDNLKTNENPKTKEISSQSITVTEKKISKSKEAKNLESENKTKKPLIKIKNTDNKENKKNKSPKKSRKSKSPAKQKSQKSKNDKASQRVLKTPEKYTQSTINKNFLVTRKTICPLSPAEALDEDEDSGLRRSKRVKVDSSKLPIYEFQRIKDFSGKDVVVQTIVATKKRTCRLEDYINEIERKKNHVIEKPKSRIIKPKRDLSDSSSDEASPETSQKHTSNKKPKTSNNETEINDSPPNNQTMEPIMLRLNESNLIEDSLAMTEISDDNCNQSRTSFLFESEDIASMKHIFNFSNKMDSLVFEKVYEGVGIKGYSASNGVLCIDPDRCTKTQSHVEACEFSMQKGECYISLNGNISKIKVGDVFSIPENCFYKIKNASSTNNAYCYFRFI